MDMQVRCEKCKGEFEVPLKEAGNIEYAQCESVFRVTYRFRTSCAHCRTVLQLTPHGPNQAIGTPLKVDANEKTQMIDMSLAGEPTLPIMPSKSPRTRPITSVRVQPRKTIVPERSKFLITSDKDLLIRRPMHVNLKARTRPGLASFRFDFKKFFLGGLITISTVVTFAMIGLATAPGKSSKPTVEIVRATKPEKPSDETPLNPAPSQGVRPEADQIVDPITYEASEPDPADKAFYVERLNRVTSKYGKRTDPIDYTSKFHKGLDIAERNHAEISAALDGTVRYAGLKGGYGNVVILSHDDGYETLYGHLAKILVKKGRNVKLGDLIGLAGNTGRSTGTHLHFEVKKDGKPVDPYRLELMSKVSRSS